MNFIIVKTTKTSAYSTSVKAYKIVNNKPIKLGELYRQAEDCSLRYLTDILTLHQKKSPAYLKKFKDEWRDGKHHIYEL